MLVELKRISASNGGHVPYSTVLSIMSPSCVDILRAIGVGVAGVPKGRAGSNPARSRISDDDVPECEEKYIRRAWRASLLSRDDEGEAFSAIAEAEAVERDVLNKFLFAPDMYLGVLDRIVSRDERFDHVVGGKYSGKRDAYMKVLPSLRSRVEAIKRRMESACASGKGKDEAIESLRKCFDDLSFRNDVVERICDDANERIFLPYMRMAARGVTGEKTDAVVSSSGMDAESFVSEFSRLMGAVEDGSSARARVIESNQRLVVFVAKKYIGRGLPFIDLVQEGNVGLVNAVRKFQYSTGHKFSTYAIWWIRQAISRAIENKSRTVRVPVHVIGQIDAMKRERNRLFGENGREATDEEIASAMRERFPAMPDITEERIVELRKASQGTVSIDCRIGDDDATFAEFVSEDGADSQRDAVDVDALKEHVASAMKCLDERERAVIDARYGLVDGIQRTLDDVGLMFDVTRERIRQIEMSALEKMRNGRCASALAEFLVR